MDSPVVAVDLEGTLTAGETWRGIARYLQDHGQAADFSRMYWTHFPHALMMKLGVADKARFNSRWITNLCQILSGWDVPRFQAMIEWVIETETWPQRRLPLLKELSDHQAAGRRVVVVSGAYQHIAEAFGRRLNADDVLATPVEINNGSLTGRLGQINVGQLKVQRLTHYLGKAILAAAYGDTKADTPMLELAAEPVAVCPDSALRKVAQARGWRILEDPAY